MRTVVAGAALLAALALAGCDGSRLARSGDGAPAASPAAVPADAAAEEPEGGPAEGSAGAPAGGPAPPDPVTTSTAALTEEQVIEIETALIDAEALLASIEAELAQDD